MPWYGCLVNVLLEETVKVEYAMADVHACLSTRAGQFEEEKVDVGHEKFQVDGNEVEKLEQMVANYAIHEPVLGGFRDRLCCP
mgnify:CR=1 FL=1